MEQTPRTEHEAYILRWQQQDVDEADRLHAHFSTLEKSGHLKDCWDVADEGRRIWNLMFSDNIEERSAADSVFASIAASAYDLALRHVARRLGVSAFAVRCALDDEGKPDAERFLAECNRRANEHADS